MRQIYIMKKAEDIHEAIRGLPPRAARKASVIQEKDLFAGRMGRASSFCKGDWKYGTQERRKAGCDQTGSV
ncbi:MAG: hypothetical protein ACLUI3_07680 [Christensenellales bacterium]